MTTTRTRVDTTGRDRPVVTVARFDMSGQSVAARLARLRAQGVVTGPASPLPPVGDQMAGRGRLFSETVIEEREDRI